LVVELICSQAGLELYRSPRGLVEGSDEGNQVKSISDWVDEQLASIIAGRTILIGATGLTEPTVVPQVADVRERRGYFDLIQHNQDYDVPPESMWYQP
jgi:hypothetical protein